MRMIEPGDVGDTSGNPVGDKDVCSTDPPFPTSVLLPCGDEFARVDHRLEGALRLLHHLDTFVEIYSRQRQHKILILRNRGGTEAGQGP